MAQDVSGGCRCGAVRYEGTASKLRSAVCACPDCQQSSGSLLSVAVGLPSKSFRVTQGEEHLKSYADTGESGQPVHRYFCSTCGTPLFAKPESYPALTSVRAITLDEPVMDPPAFAIFGNNIPRWIHLEGIQVD